MEGGFLYKLEQVISVYVMGRLSFRRIPCDFCWDPPLAGAVWYLVVKRGPKSSSAGGHLLAAC